MHISDYRGKIPFLRLQLHIFIYNSFYGLCRYIVKRKSAFDFECSLYCLYTSVKGNFFNNDVEVSSGQLKRFNQSVIDPKCLLKIAATSFCFYNNLSFSSNIIFSCILLFLFEKYGLHAFQNGLELPSKLSFSKYCRFTTRFRGHVNLTMSLGLFDLFNLIWRSDLIIICSRRFLLKWVFWFSQIFLFSWEHVLSRIETNLFL